MTPPSTTATFQVFADYFQVNLEDENSTAAEPPADLGQQLVPCRIAVWPGNEDRLTFSTARNMDVPVEVAVLNAAPDDTDLGDWDHVVEASLKVPSGRLVITGPTDQRASVTAGRALWHLPPADLLMRPRHPVRGRA